MFDFLIITRPESLYFIEEKNLTCESRMLTDGKEVGRCIDALGLDLTEISSRKDEYGCV